MSADSTPDSLAQAIAEESDNGIEWGVYVERKDGDVWTPLIYTSNYSREHAENSLPEGDPFRNARLIRRTVGDWKVVPADAQ